MVKINTESKFKGWVPKGLFQRRGLWGEPLVPLGFYRDKRGISEVFTIVLILLFTIILIFLVWQVVVPRIRGGMEKTSVVETVGESFTIEKINAAQSKVTILREIGSANLIALRFSNGTKEELIVSTITAGMRETFDLTMTLTPGSEITVSPVFKTAEGKNVTGVAFSKKVSGGGVPPGGGTQDCTTKAGGVCCATGKCTQPISETTGCSDPTPTCCAQGQCQTWIDACPTGPPQQTCIEYASDDFIEGKTEGGYCKPNTDGNVVVCAEVNLLIEGINTVYKDIAGQYQFYRINFNPATENTNTFDTLFGNQFEGGTITAESDKIWLNKHFSNYWLIDFSKYPNPDILPTDILALDEKWADVKSEIVEDIVPQPTFSQNDLFIIKLLGNTRNNIELPGRAPAILNPQPSGTISTSDPTISVQTNEDATCKYSDSDLPYSIMPGANMLDTTDSRQHSKTLTGLSDGDYTYYVRCKDVSGNKNRSSAKIEFTISTAAPAGPQEFFDGFESGSIDSNEWETYSSKTGTINGRIDVIADGTCTNVKPNNDIYLLRMDVDTNSNANLNELITKKDFSGATSMTLEFYWTDTGDENHNCTIGGDNCDSWTGHGNYDAISFTCDGTTWYLIKHLGPKGYIDRTWNHENIVISDLPNFCSNVDSKFKIKFQQYDNYKCISDGIYFDDIKISWTS